MCTLGPEYMLLTVDEVAALIKVPVPTLIAWHRDPARGPACVFIGESMRFRLSAVRAWIDMLPSVPLLPELDQ